MFGIVKKMLIVLLASIINDSNHKKCMPLSNQKCEIKPTLINYILMNKVKNFTTIHLRLN